MHLHLWKENDNHMVIKRKILQFKAGSFFLFSFFLSKASYIIVLKSRSELLLLADVDN